MVINSTIALISKHTGMHHDEVIIYIKISYKNFIYITILFNELYHCIILNFFVNLSILTEE